MFHLQTHTQTHIHMWHTSHNDDTLCGLSITPQITTMSSSPSVPPRHNLWFELNLNKSHVPPHERHTTTTFCSLVLFTATRTTYLRRRWPICAFKWPSRCRHPASRSSLLLATQIRKRRRCVDMRRSICKKCTQFQPQYIQISNQKPYRTLSGYPNKKWKKSTGIALEIQDVYTPTHTLYQNVTITCRHLWRCLRTKQRFGFN